VQETQRALPRGSALLMFLPAQRSFFLYTVTPGGATARVSGADRAAVEAMCREYQEALRMRERYRDSLNVLQRAKDTRIDELTTALHSLLVRPVEGDIAESSTLTVVAPPPLAGVPIHALRRTGGRRGSDYVIQDLAVTYLPSAFLLASTAPPAVSAGTDIFALGFQGGSGWDVEYELRDIRAFFKDVRLHFGAAATVDTLLRSRADILHLAAEFSASDLSAANAFCILSDGKAFNTSRRVPWERFFLLPPFPVAVVSDLGTGGATMHREFPFLFLGGGTPTLVLQSYVPTRKTKKFFGEIFYTATLDGAPPRAAARQAVLEMIRTPEYSSPSLWAPFMIWGK